MSIKRHINKYMVGSIILVVVIVGIISNFAIPVNAQQAEVKVINPETGDITFKFYTNETGVGTRFNATVWIYNIADLFAFQVYLTVDDSLLNITRAWLPTWDSQYVFYGKTTVPVPPAFYDFNNNNLVESVLVGSSILFGDTFAGSGLLAIIELEIIKGPGINQNFSCNLSISKIDEKYGYYTYFLDSNLHKIAVSMFDGLYEYLWAGELPYLTIEPKSYVTQKLGDVNFTVWIRRVSPDQKLKNITLRISYNSSLLRVKEVFEGSFLKETGETVFNWTSENGYLTIMSYLKQGYATASEGPIATITFEGIYQGYKVLTSRIRFDSVELRDIDDSLIGCAEPQSASYTITPGIAIRLDKDVVYAGSNVTIRGWIIPPMENINVTISFKREHFPTEEIIVRTDKNGNFSYIWKAPSEEAVFNVKAYFSCDSVEIESEIVSLNVTGGKQPSKLFINVSPNRIVRIGEDILISGKLEPAVKGVKIKILYRFGNKTDWELLVELETDTKGEFSYHWSAREVGDYQLRAYWPGNEETEALYSNIVTLTVIETGSNLAGLPYVIIGIIIILILFGLVYSRRLEGVK